MLWVPSWMRDPLGNVGGQRNIYWGFVEDGGRNHWGLRDPVRMGGMYWGMTGVGRIHYRLLGSFRDWGEVMKDHWG